MKFLLFIGLICAIYYFAIGPKQNAHIKTNSVGLDSIEMVKQLEYEKSLVENAPSRKPKIPTWIFILAGVFVVVVINLTTNSARTVTQKKSRQGARNYMIDQIKESGEKVIGYGSADDDLGKTEWIETQDRTLNKKRWYLFNMDDSEKYIEK